MQELLLFHVMHVGSPAYFELLIQLTTGEGSSTNASGRSVISLCKYIGTRHNTSHCQWMSSVNKLDRTRPSALTPFNLFQAISLFWAVNPFLKVLPMIICWYQSWMGQSSISLTCLWCRWEDSIDNNDTGGGGARSPPSRGSRGRGRGEGRSAPNVSFVTATGEPISGRRCFICGDPSHFANVCPNRGMLSHLPPVKEIQLPVFLFLQPNSLVIAFWYR